MNTSLSEMNPSALGDNTSGRPRHEPRARVLIANGRHNAFPTIARFEGAWWIAYREGDAHGGPAEVVVLRSTDAQQWREAHRIALLADNRDPQLVVQGDRLCLFVLGTEAQGHRTALFTARAGDERFTPAGDTNVGPLVLWRPIAHAGQFWCAAYASRPQRRLQLIRSMDGLDWRPVADLADPGAGHGLWSETAIVVGPNDRMTAALRFKWSPKRPEQACLAELWQSDPPYTQWRTQATLPFRIEGPSLTTFGGQTYLFTRGFNALGSANAMNIHRLDLDTGRTDWHASIPTMRDCAYGQAALSGPDAMLLVFYSTAPDGVNLYLATIPLA